MQDHFQDFKSMENLVVYVCHGLNPAGKQALHRHLLNPAPTSQWDGD